ncbi:MAG: hypothetical protein K2K49_02255 [Duncaniella sp.]|nr:hypothetical protein [Duncaniella sp.]
MAKFITILRVAVVLCILAIIAMTAYMWKTAPEPSRIRTYSAKVLDLSPMARLCTLDIYEDVPVKGRVGKKHLVARMTLNGSITFDLDNVIPEERGDTLRVTLPPERVEIYESTEPESYIVIDTWNDALFGSSTLTTSQENAIKAKVKENFCKKLYARGDIARARAEAVRNLTAMLAGLTGKIVIVTDPTPCGTENFIFARPSEK